MITLDLDFSASSDDHKTFELIAPEPVQLALKPVTVRTEATIGDIIQAFAFDGKTLLKANNGVIACKQCALDSP